MADRDPRWRDDYEEEPRQWSRRHFEEESDWNRSRFEREREGARYPGEYDREYRESYLGSGPPRPRSGESGSRQDWQGREGERGRSYSGLPERSRVTRSQWTSANPYEAERDRPPRMRAGPHAYARSEDYREDERSSDFEVIPGAGYGPFPGGSQRLGPWGGPRSEGTESARGSSTAGYQGARYAARGPKNYQRSDERIREDICERLWHSASIDSSEVTVEVKEGEVTLEGTVPERRMKHMIEDVADGCAGVKEVHNRLRVGSALPHPGL